MVLNFTRILCGGICINTDFHKKVGEELSFGGLLGSGPVMPVNTASPARFINRGGRIPAPLQSLRN